MRDPTRALLASAHPAIRHFAREIAGERSGPTRALWDLPEPRSLFRRQRPNGSWRYTAKRVAMRGARGYDELESYRSLGILVEKYGFTREHEAIERVAEFLLASQTDEGDLRGIYARQPTPNYTGAILELLIKAGYAKDRRIERALRWLASARQDDGGWAIALRTRGMDLRVLETRLPPIEPDRAKPSSHLITGIALRAFAAHPTARRSAVARGAADLLAARMFERDRYPDRASPSMWTSFSYPFWFTDLISALDSIGRIATRASDAQVQRALAWLAKRQRADGLLDVKLLRTRDPHLREWVTLAYARAARRFAA